MKAIKLPRRKRADKNTEVLPPPEMLKCLKSFFAGFHILKITHVQRVLLKWIFLLTQNRLLSLPLLHDFSKGTVSFISLFGS